MRRIILIGMIFITMFFLNDFLLAQTGNKGNDVSPAATTNYSHPFVRMLEDVELTYHKDKKHWRKGDYPPYQFIICDVDKGRARLSYKKEGSRIEFYLVYFEYYNNEWHFELNDVIFMPKKQPDGSKTTLKDALKTRNKMYWFASDKISKK